MSTQKNVENFNPKDFLNALENSNVCGDYQNLGFTLKSLCKITQTALLAEQGGKQLSLCHDSLDIYNIVRLIYDLIPQSEWELLDKLNS